ncbi:tryptophan 7-halogenase [Gilvimarinus agarilyticus]|uniref:tryptophan halogenase family protein n=1 Tax=Gilvimarinus sp. 2_MG-2023 TaxID=3062666 RepID=UPI001C09D93C|nr:tryptophan halogenase family protein [Gilvimarinus sp. 2_MG-2023]MBU2886394.1 tryptophan 7-halogenase [Gilvimarinus agarilyticus]MDO6571073.1 tryptophan 7-halogenase [Gilvimarinus sp. 2_MG-2023]
MQQPIQSIVIVGGGTAGWLCAGVIAARVQATQANPIAITLIESPNIPTVGVGEGTWPTMRNTLKKMGIRETDFIRECQVSFKQGAKFSRWHTGKTDDEYYHPLILPQGFNRMNLAPHWLTQQNGASFSQTVCPQDVLCENSLAPKLITTPEYQGLANYAYHLDAGAFADFLKRHCTQTLGVRHILDDVASLKDSENGDICALHTENTGEISADLFIDCTGFKSKLIGEHYQVPFKSCEDVLFANTALAVHLPYHHAEDEIASHTISTAQSAGWIWDIGLPTRRGVGHVFSSRYTNRDNAYRELERYAAQSGHNLDSLNVREIPITPGHREKFWVNNCVAVGLSAGFLEPLEASALVLVEISAEFIASQLPANRAAMNSIANRFNRTFRYRWDRIIDFLKLHYMLNERNDSEFWIDNRDKASIPDSLQELLDLWRYQPPWDNDFDHATEVFPAASYQYVLYGMGFKTEPHPAGLHEQQQRMAAQEFAKNQQITHKLCTALPSNRELLKKIHQYGMAPV